MNSFRKRIGRIAKAPASVTAPKRRLHGLGLWWTFAGALVVIAALIVAIAQNSRHVRLHYLGWHLSVSLIVVLLTTALAAVLLDEAGGLIWRRRRRARNGNVRELAQLRIEHDRRDEPQPSALLEPPLSGAELPALPPRSVEPHA